MSLTARPTDGDSSNGGDRPGLAAVAAVFVSVVGFAASVITIWIWASSSRYLGILISLAIPGVVLAVALSVAHKYPQQFRGHLREVDKLFREWSHWLVALCLSLSAAMLILALAIYQALPVPRGLCEVPLLGSSGDIFNSCKKQHGGACYIEASAPEKNNEGVAVFKIEVDQSAARENERKETHSSGWYKTFYGSPCNRLEYRSFRFSWKASCPGKEANVADVGVRLVVDDPSPSQVDKELVVYERPSVRNLSAKEGDWSDVAIDTRDFAWKKEPPGGVDGNQINKVVFFVNPDTADLCGGGTFWFKEVRFVRNER